VKVLIDTNVLLSAAVRNRLPERVVLEIAGRDDWRWIVTDEILAEYVEVLKRPKFKLDDELIRRWSELLVLRTLNIGHPPAPPEFPRDPSDSPFLAAALFSRRTI
jgi:putative PIN family toxin of toxin-antitoxin system